MLTEHSTTIHSISMAGYEFLTVANSKPERRAVSVNFEKLPLAISPHFSPFRLNVFNKSNCIANLCPHMINFDGGILVSVALKK